MGVVYKAYDTVIKRQVAVKTLHDIRDPAALDLFYKEWGVLASLVHPNIVQVYDIGGFESDGETVPFFVMPLLPGVTLSKLIYDKSHRLTAERAVDIIHQACRGIQAAHESNLVHRDIKPSNILVLDDDSVKIIDFGVAHLVGKEGSTGLKGTPFYMAPEQIRMQRPSAQTDVYSLGVVAYEALTGRRPIAGSTDAEIAEAILSHIPPAASEINPALNQVMSRVLHKAMAKHPWHRFSSAREFGDALLKAVRNEPIEIFDPARVQPRIDRAQRAFEGGDFGFASEVLAELEGEGCLDPQITLLRRKLAEVQRKSRIQTLIDGARRCLDEQEHTLALRKVQEALDLDPHDGDVLLLKARIEEASRSRKIDDWMRLAERHLENSAFAHARQALQSVLDAQPGQPDAERLLAQVNERENEYVRAQEQKSKLHQQAVGAWERGEISSALSKLDRLLKLDREAPGTDAERVSEYQRFFQQVRSEHETINNAYSEARALLEQGEFRRALEICDLHLKKYPGHALFRALKLDIDDRQGRSLSSYIAEVDQRLASEPDLDKRVSLLEEALGRYPAEAHFERALRQAKQRRELLHSIVARARQLEESGHFSEAIEQWKVLQSIDSSYPGVEIEIERLVARRDQQARGEAKAEWVQRAEHELDAGEAARAVKTCARALEEFPDDPELAQVAEAARQAVERSSRAYELSQQAQQHFEQQEFEKGIGKLREATDLDPRNPEFRALLGKSLLEQARTLIQSDWRAAEQLVEEAAGLAPDHALTGSLRTLIHDSKREEAVSWCLAKARQLQAEGKAGEACQLVERVLETYPGVSRLERLRDTLRPLATASSSDSARARALEELQRIGQQAERTGGEAITRGLAARVEEIERSWPGDPEVGATAAEAQRKLREGGTPPEGVPALPAKPPGRAANAGGGEPETLAPEALAGGVAAAGKPGTVAESPGSAVPMREAPASGQPANGRSKPAGKKAPTSQRSAAAPQVQRRAGGAQASLAAAMAALRQGGARNKYLWLGASAALALALVVLAIAWFNRTPPAPPAALAEVRITVEPAGAKVALSGDGETFECTAPDCLLNVPAGEYALTASLAGYRPWRETVSIEAGPPIPLARHLEPLPVLLRLISDLQRATVRVAGQEIEDPLEEGFLELSLSPGVYPVEVSSGSMAASLMVDVAPGRAPRFAEAIEAREFQIYAVASFGGAAELRSTAQAVEVQVDGQDRGAAAEGALQLAGLAAGLHELTFSTAEGQIRRSFEIGEEPALTAVLITDRNLGSVIVEAGVEGAEVVINDGRYRRETGNNGRARLWLAPGEYTAAVAKDGHEPAAPQTFTIRKGDEARLEFELPALPQMALLEMSGAPAGAEVWLDDKRLGQIGRDGTFGTSVPAGPHRVELRNLPEMYQPQPAQKQFAEGATVEFDAGDLPLRAVKGRVQIHVEPADAAATVTIQQGGGPEQEIRPGTHYRDAGDYVVSAAAPGYEGSQSGQRVVVGQTTVFHLTLRGETRRVPQRRLGLADLGKIGGFENVDGVMVRNGGEFALLPLSPATGSYTFTANVRGGSLFRGVGIGKARIQWVVDYSDEGNYALYEFGENALSRTLVNGGKRGSPDRIPHDCPKADYYSISVDVSPAAVTQKALCGGQWIVLEAWQADGANLADGKFGFFVPNNSTLAISHFEAVGP